jgi:hypothetical protein
MCPVRAQSVETPGNNELDDDASQVRIVGSGIIVCFEGGICGTILGRAGVSAARCGHQNTRLWVDIIEGKKKERGETLEYMHCISFNTLCFIPPPMYFLPHFISLLTPP